MAVAREHGSVVASLAELRMIEEQRIADERTAIRTREQQRLEAIAAAAQAAQEAEAAQVRAQHEARLALETARIQAEREARMRVEAAAAAEHARQFAMLTAEREAREHELRRAEVAQKRPTWMVVVTGAAVVLAGVLVWFALDKASASAESERARSLAEQDRLAAIDAQKAAELEMEGFRQELALLDVRVAEAKQMLATAQTAADRKAAQAELAKQEAALRKKREAEQGRIEAERKRKRGERIDLSNCDSGSLDCLKKR